MYGLFGNGPTGGGPEFSGEPEPRFVMGSVTGARHFDVTPDGALTGVVFRREWQQGINYADCRVHLGYRIPGIGVSRHVVRHFVDDPDWHPEDHPSWKSAPPRIHVGWRWDIDGEEGIYEGTEKPEPVTRDWKDPEHNFAKCVCGWYGYLKGSMNYVQPDRVAGIIEGFGKVRQGSRGFRVEKARIRALFVPDVTLGPLPYHVPHDPSLSMSEALRRAGERSRVEGYMRDLIASRYPDVPMFTSLDRMLAEFPTDPPKEEG